MNPRLIKEVKELVSLHSGVRIDSFDLKSKLGEDLGVVGDDADELFSDLSTKFEVNLNGFCIDDYFPSEASADMYCYLATKVNNRRNLISNLLNVLSISFWKLFSSNKIFKSISVEDLVNLAETKEWKRNYVGHPSL